MLDLNQRIYVHFLRRRGDNSTIRYWLLARRGLWEDVPEDGDNNKFQPSAWAEWAGRTKTTNLHHHQEGSSGGQGWRNGESTSLPPMWPGFKSRRRRHMWVEFVVGSLPCAERFFSGYSGFSLSSKTNTSKFQFDLQHTDTFKRVHMNS